MTVKKCKWNDQEFQGYSFCLVQSIIAFFDPFIFVFFALYKYAIYSYFEYYYLSRNYTSTDRSVSITAELPVDAMEGGDRCEGSTCEEKRTR